MDELRPICRKALNHYGSTHSMLQAQRVGARFLAALSDFYEGHSGSHKKYVEALANMRFMLEILTLIAGPLSVGKCVNEEIERMKKDLHLSEGKEVSVLIRTTEGKTLCIAMEQLDFSPEDAVRTACREYATDYNFCDLEIDRITVICKEDDAVIEYKGDENGCVPG